jgi:hypothetical protein
VAILPAPKEEQQEKYRKNDAEQGGEKKNFHQKLP